MTTKDDGGQAFPQPMAIGPSGDLYPAYPGMTLRDWFAGQALVGLCMSQLTEAMTFDTIAANAYRAADSMLIMRDVEVPK